MNKTTTIRSFGWSIGLILLFSWNLQAEVNLLPAASLRPAESLKRSSLAIDPTPISLTATAGVPFTYKIPVLLLPTNTAYSSLELPGNGLSLSYDTYPPSITGTPNATGVMNLTINAHNVVNNVESSAWVPITITVNPPTPISLTATAGVPFTYKIPVLVLQNNAVYSSPELPGNGLSLSYDTYPPSITGTPNATGVMNLTINAHNVVNNVESSAWVPITITVNPGPGGTLTLVAPTYNCTTGAFHFNTSGGDGTPITFFAIGITGPTTNPDQFVDTELRTVADAQPLQLQATQSGITVTYVWNIRAQCPVGSAPPPTGSLTLLAPTYNCATGAFRFNTSGGDGSPITFFAIGITGPTTNPDQFVDTEQRTVNDVQPFLLQATQNGTTVTYLWNLKAACGRARTGEAGPAPGLSVSVLGNPVVGDRVYIEVSGAEGQPLLITLINQQGRSVSEERIGQAAALERLSVKLSSSPGVQLLQVSNLSQTKVVRVLKME